jgi:hypothetical protein
MSLMGPKAKCSLRVDVFRFGPNNRLRSRGSACPFGAISGSRGRGLLDQIAGAARPDGASLWKSCFAEAVDIHLSLPLTGMGYPFRYSEMGLNLKDLGHRLPSFCISP